MSNRTNKYSEKAYNPEINIDEEIVHLDSTDWLAYCWKKRFLIFSDLQQSRSKL